MDAISILYILMGEFIMDRELEEMMIFCFNSYVGIKLEGRDICLCKKDFEDESLTPIIVKINDACKKLVDKDRNKKLGLNIFTTHNFNDFHSFASLTSFQYRLKLTDNEIATILDEKDEF